MFKYLLKPIYPKVVLILLASPTICIMVGISGNSKVSLAVNHLKRSPIIGGQFSHQNGGGGEDMCAC